MSCQPGSAIHLAQANLTLFYFRKERFPVIRNFKRSAAILGALAISTSALAACSESESSNGSSEAASSVEGLSGASGQLVGEGASSQQNAMDTFGIAFNEATGGKASLSYTASGSGAGVEAFTNGTVDFAGSDSPLSEEEQKAADKRCKDNEAWNLPSVIGPVGIAYHLEGVDELNLSVGTVAKIFKGEIKKWNDPAIAAENEGANLPDKDISVVYRSDESGTSSNFQKFLKAATGSWEGKGKQFPQTVGAGANGSSGVASEVKNVDGGITYVEAGFAKDQGLNVAKLDFGAGPVELSKESVGVALDNLKFKGQGNNLVVDSDALFASKDKGAYPLILTTYNIVCSAGYDEDKAGLVKDFMTTMLQTQDQIESRGYIPVTGAHLDRLKKAVDALA